MLPSNQKAPLFFFKKTKPKHSPTGSGTLHAIESDIAVDTWNTPVLQ